MPRTFTQSLGWKIVIGALWLTLALFPLPVFLVIAEYPTHPFGALLAALLMSGGALAIIYETCIKLPTVEVNETEIRNLLNFTKITIGHLRWSQVLEIQVRVIPIEGSSALDIDYYLIGAKGKVRFNDEIRNINELIAMIGDRIPPGTPVRLIDSFAVANSITIHQLKKFKRISRADLGP